MLAAVCPGLFLGGGENGRPGCQRAGCCSLSRAVLPFHVCVGVPPTCLKSLPSPHTHRHTHVHMCTHTYILTCMQTQTSTCAHTPLCRAQCCPGSLLGRRRVISLPRLGGEATLLCQPRGISLVIPLSYTQDPDDSSKAAVDGDRVGRTRRSLQQLGQVEPWAGGREV